MQNRMLTVNEVSRAFLSRNDVREGDLNAVVKSVNESIVKYLNVDRVSVWLRAGQTDTFCAKDIYDADIRNHGNTSLISLDAYHNLKNVLYTERFIAVESVEKDMRTAVAFRHLWKKDEIKSTLIVPIITRGFVKGFVQIDQKTDFRIFTADQINFAVQMADVITQTILNKKIIQKDRQLNLMSNTFTGSATQRKSDITDWLVRIVNLVDAQSGLVFLTSQAMKQVHCAASINTEMDFTDAVLEFGVDAPGITAETNTPLMINDYQEWAHATKLFKERQEIKTVLSVPLTIDDEVKAVVMLCNKQKETGFTDFDLENAKTYIKQTKTALLDYEVYQVKNRLTNRSILIQDIYDIANHISDNMHLLHVVKTIIAEWMKADMVNIAFDQDLTVHGIAKKTANEFTALLKQDAILNNTVFIQNTETYRGVFKTAITKLAKSEIRSVILAERAVDNGSRLLISIGSRKEGFWVAEDVKTANVLMDVLGSLLAKTSLETRLITQEALLSRMNDIGQGLNRMMNLDDAVAVIGREAIRLMDGTAAIMLMKDKQGLLSIPWIDGVNAKDFHQTLHTTQDVIQATFLKANYPATISDVKQLNLPQVLNDLFLKDHIETIQTIPFLYNDQVVGVTLVLFDRQRVVRKEELRILQMFATQASLTIQNSLMYEQLENGYIDVILALAKTMDERELTVSDIGLRIADLAEKSARRLGLAEEEIRDLHWAALLHDVGKVTIPEKILRKPGELSKAEWAEIKKHPLKGEEILRPISRFRNVGRIIRNFREKYDGSGYPDRLKGSEIPVAARVLSVADAFESMISDRAYQKAYTMDQALAEIEKNSGKQFDPLIVQTFMDTVRENVTTN